MAGQRTRLAGAHLLNYPAIAAVFGHPDILKLSATLTGEPEPFLQEIVSNRYIPPHEGIKPHLDEDFGELVPPFMRITWALFLDDISADSGALLISPGTHLRNYRSDAEPAKKSPTVEEVQGAPYEPIELKAGTLIVRASDVWHGVAPIRHLRRYITGSHTSRTRISNWMKEDLARIKKERSVVDPSTIPVILHPSFY